MHTSVSGRCVGGVKGFCFSRNTISFPPSHRARSRGYRRHGQVDRVRMPDKTRRDDPWRRQMRSRRRIVDRAPVRGRTAGRVPESFALFTRGSLRSASTRNNSPRPKVYRRDTRTQHHAPSARRLLRARKRRNQPRANDGPGVTRTHANPRT